MTLLFNSGVAATVPYLNTIDINNNDTAIVASVLSFSMKTYVHLVLSAIFDWEQRSFAHLHRIRCQKKKARYSVSLINIYIKI